MNETLTPAEITAKSTEVALAKAHTPFYKILINGILAWMFIAIGAMFSVNSLSGLEGLPYGLTKLIAGVTFSIGLILVMIAGAELFTGDALMVTAWLDKKISLGKWIKNLGVIWGSNFIGALLIIGLLLLAGWHTSNGENITELLLHLGVKKLQYGRWQALSLWILCNLLVCLGVWLARAGKRATDKIVGMIFPITAFVACGFEHSVANMFYLPFAYVLQYLGYQVEGMVDMTLTSLAFHNLLPVTLGNIIGGAVIGVTYWILYHQKKNLNTIRKDN